MSYVQTKLSIYERAKDGLITESEKQKLLEEFDNRHALSMMCEKYGLIPVDDDNIVYESIRAKIGEIIRKRVDLKAIKDRWNEMASKFGHSTTTKKITPTEKKDLSNSYDVCKKENVSYKDYKKAFSKLASSVGLPNSDVILEFIEFKKDDSNNDTISVRYSKGKQQVIVPAGTLLLHVSPVKGITELKPSFRSRVVGKYMYPTPRCYFTLGKEIKASKAGLEKTKTYKYTPSNLIKTAYIDPACTQYSLGAVFVETSFPIKVVDYDKKMKKMFGESATEYDMETTIAKFSQLIMESYKDGLITSDQAVSLMEYLRD